MDYNIRKATLDDLSVIQQFNLQLFKKEHEEFDKTLDCNWTFSVEGKEYFKNRITEDSGFAFIASLGDKPVGYIVGGLTNSPKHRTITKLAELENMFVLNEHRSSGIGTKLYEKFLEWCKNKEVERIKVVASSENIKAIQFYQKKGFQNYDLVMERKIE